MDISNIEKTTGAPPVDPVEQSPTIENVGEKEVGSVARRASTDSTGSDARSSGRYTVVGDDEDAEQGNNGLSRVITPKRDPIIVPRSHRRGLLGRFSLIAEVENQYDYSNKVKCFSWPGGS